MRHSTYYKKVILCLVHAKLFPCEEYVIECIMRMRCVKGIGETHTAVLKLAHINRLVMEIGKQLPALP